MGSAIGVVWGEEKDERFADEGRPEGVAGSDVRDAGMSGMRFMLRSAERVS